MNVQPVSAAVDLAGRPGLQDAPSICPALRRAGFSAPELDGIRGGNFPNGPWARAGRQATASGQDAYFITRLPTAGSAATTCLVAPPRTLLYALMIVGRLDLAARASVTDSSASATSSPRLTR